MSGSDNSASAADIRAQLGHPVVDTDGHMIEHMPVFLEFLKEVAGPDTVKRYLVRSQEDKNGRWQTLSPAERRNERIARPPFRGVPAANSLDRATAMLPKLLRSRLDEFGFDFTIVYPTLGFFLVDEADEELRRALCRAHNTMTAEIFGSERDRMTPAACIPLGTPQEGIEELEFAVRELDLKVAMIANLVHRPIESVSEHGSKVAEQAYWTDNLALDSEYDYDPFWAACVELGIAPTAHSFMQGHGARRSISNYMYNQIGHFADAGEAFAKALFFGGVTRRFPELNFGILEGGVGWAASLFSTLVEVWHKRGASSIDQLDPANIDSELLEQYFAEYGGSRFVGTQGAVDGLGYGVTSTNSVIAADPVDDFAACAIERAEDIADLFAKTLYFGCEADDVMTRLAFDSKMLPFGTRLKPIFGSDIGHWDVPDMREVLGEAYELVEDDLITAADFRDFVLNNPIKLHGGMNPNFFKGTVVENEAAAVLAEEPTTAKVEAA